MNYLKIYNALIAKRSHDIPSTGELHHIIPRSMGGGNGKNIILLTCREHYIAHKLLYKIYRNREMAAAWHMMSTVGKTRISSFDYAIIKEINRKHITGSGNPRHITNLTSEQRAELSARCKVQATKNWSDPEISTTMRAKLVANNKNRCGIPMSKETKIKLSVVKGIAIMCNETKVIYPSIRSAAIAMNLQASCIRKHLKGLKKDVKGSTFIAVSKDVKI